MFRFSNWVFLVAAVVFAYVADGDASPLHMVPEGFGEALTSIAWYCGFASFGIQCIIWIANFLRWLIRRRVTP